MNLRFIYTGRWLGAVEAMQGLASVTRRGRAENPHTFLLDAGNFSRGVDVQDALQGERAIDFMNTAGYDAALPGPNDLRWGGEELLRLARRAHFPFLLTNVGVNETDAFQPFVVMELERLKIALLGVTGASDELSAGDPAQSLDYTISMLRDEGAGLFIVLSNLGFEENAALIRTVKGISAVISLSDGINERDIVYLNNIPLASTPRNPYMAGSLSLVISGL